MQVVGEHTELSEYKKRAARRLILGFEGTNFPTEMRNWKELPAGYILFQRNIESMEQVFELNKVIQAFHPLSIRSVDQEGGRVRRIKTTNWPRMRYVGQENNIEKTKHLATLMAEELLALGFTTNWAPICDVDSNPANPVIGDRSFSNTPNEVSKHVVAFINSMQTRGISCSAKHFPGHGDTDIDSHFDLPVVHKERKDLDTIEFPPFREAIATGVHFVMTAHVLFPNIDPEHPATMSSKIIRNILREEFKYDGLIVSDDMEMKAVRGRYPLEYQLEQSTNAGVDLFLMCKEHDLQQEAFEILVKKQEQSSDFAYLCHLSCQRLQKYLDNRQNIAPSISIPSLSVVGSESHRVCADIFNNHHIA